MTKRRGRSAAIAVTNRHFVGVPIGLIRYGDSASTSRSQRRWNELIWVTALPPPSLDHAPTRPTRRPPECSLATNADAAPAPCTTTHHRRLSAPTPQHDPLTADEPTPPPPLAPPTSPDARHPDATRSDPNHQSHTQRRRPGPPHGPTSPGAHPRTARSTVPRPYRKSEPHPPKSQTRKTRPYERTG